MLNFKNAYMYNKSTKEYQGITQAQQSPLQTGIWLLPADSTFTQPIIPIIDKAVVWNIEKLQWEYIDDNRNKKIYNKQDSRIIQCQSNYLLDPIPEDYTLIVPPDTQKWYKFNGTTWNYYFPPETKQNLSQYTYKLKCDVAYTGVNLVVGDDIYVFETDQGSITMCNSKLAALDVIPGDSIIWKVYKNGFATTIRLTKDEFKSIFLFGMNMVDQSFILEGQLNSNIELMTDQQLANQEYINTFKQNIKYEFNKINKTYQLQSLTII